MREGFSGPGNKSDPKPMVMARLASRNDLPQRARMLLGASLDLSRRQLADIINVALDEFSKHLERLSDASRSMQQRQNYFTSSRELARARQEVLPRFQNVLEDFFAGYDHIAGAPEDANAKLSRGRDTLSLVETGELEESLALQEFVARAEVRHSEALYALGHRFAVLVAAPALEPQEVPIGPAQVGKALRHGIGVVAIPADHRVLFYRTFDQIAAKELTLLYDSINSYFVEQHILMNLRAQNLRGKKVPTSAAAAKTETAASGEDDAGGAEAAVMESPQAALQSSTTQGGPTWDAVRANNDAASTSWPSLNAPSRQPASAATNSAWYDPQSLADDRDVELFSTLRELLAGSREEGEPSPPSARAFGRNARSGDAMSSDGAANGSARFEPTFDDVQGVLGALQSRPPPPYLIGGKPALRSVENLKQDLLKGLRELSPDRQQPELNGEDSDTIDLVGMLFENMSTGLPAQSGTRSLLPRLQVPLLRVALRDKSFFTRKAHPARQLLNAIAETGDRWMDGSDADADSDLLNRLQIILDRLSSDFDGDLGVIEDLLGDLSEHVQTLTRKAKVAERRQVDAAVGREKLAVAREAAATAVASRISANPPGAFVRTLLEQAWSDVLALTLLRQGESSDVYKKRIEVADRLIQSSTASKNGEVDASAQNEELREEIESGLSQVGYHEEDIQAVVKRLLMPDGAANDDEVISDTELAIKLAAKARLGEGDRADERPSAVTARRLESLQLNTAELNTLAELKKLPFGTWFEFITNQQGDRVRKKMAWSSKLTGRAIFVNQRGSRTDDTTLEELAREMARGQIMLANAESETFVDRAWHTIVSSLKRIGNIAGAFAPPPPEPIA